MIKRRGDIAFLALLCISLVFVIIRDYEPKHEFSALKHKECELNPIEMQIFLFDIPNIEQSAHSSFVFSLCGANSKSDDKDFMLVYFAGSKEGARDVKIYASFFSQKNMQYTKPKAILSAHSLSKMTNKFIKNLGNPVGFVDENGKVNLFVVGVSLGGWATSKIYWLEFSDDLEILYLKKELNLSPFFNFSFLVRSGVIPLQDGFILPIYHELARKYPLLLHISSDLRQKAFRPTMLHSQLQPSFVAFKRDEMVGIYRNHKHYNSQMFVSLCQFINRHINCRTIPSNLKNYDSSSILFKMDDNIYLLHNQSKDLKAESNDANPQQAREELWLYTLDMSSLTTKARFIPLFKIDFVNYEASYPSVAMNNQYALISYTFNRIHIRSVLIPKAYLMVAVAQSKGYK